MADIIHLSLKAGLRRRELGSASQTSAQILFFTGVRYHKHPEPLPEAADAGDRHDDAGPSSGRRRRRRA